MVQEGREGAAGVEGGCLLLPGDGWGGGKSGMLMSDCRDNRCCRSFISLIGWWLREGTRGGIPDGRAGRCGTEIKGRIPLFGILCYEL